MRIFLSMGFLLRFVAAEVFLGDVDEPIPIEDVTAVAGLKGRIPCDIDPPRRDESVIMVLWYKDGKDGEPIYSVDTRGRTITRPKIWSDPHVFGERAIMRTNVKPAELEIDSLEWTDSGMYRCRVDFRNSPTKNYKVNFTVVVLPNRPVIYTGPNRSLAKILQPFNEGSELSLLCEVIGGSPSPAVVWYLGDKMLDDEYTLEQADVTTNRLDIQRVTREFLRARLVCQANNTALVPPLAAEIILDVNLKPLVVNITNKRPYLSALTTYEIECTSSGSKPEAIITWWKGNHQVKHMARNFADSLNVTRSVLSYVPTIEDDGKYLTCRAENPVVSDSALEDKWALVIRYAPVVTITLGSSLKANDINEGDDVYFECDVRANPKAYKLVWYKNGKELSRNASAGIVLPGGQSLVLQSVTRQSAGEYSCMAANFEGKSTSRPVTLEVMYAPICKDGSSSQVVGALKHETISLVCGVQSKPPPTTFHWTFNNSGELMNVPVGRFAQVKPSRLITNHWHGSRLNYTPENDMDYGTVACWARNTIGVQKVPCLFQIIVAGKPYPLQNCTYQQSTGPYAYRIGQDDFKTTDSKDAEWLIVKCYEGFNGGLPVTNYELEVYSEENDYHVNTIYQNHTDRSSGVGPVFEVPGLEPGRNYRLLLYAVNAKGRSEPVVLEPVSLKGVAMYTTDRGTSKDSNDYSLLIACFAGGITAVCILIVGVTLTLYRRNHLEGGTTSTTTTVTTTTTMTLQPFKPETTEMVQYERKDERVVLAAADSNHAVDDGLVKELFPSALPPDEDPDVIPSRLERRPDIFDRSGSGGCGAGQGGMGGEGGGVVGTDGPRSSVGSREFSWYAEYGHVSSFSPSSSDLRAKDSWVYASNEYAGTVGNDFSPVRPSTLPVRHNHDVYTRSPRIQESCI